MPWPKRGAYRPSVATSGSDIVTVAFAALSAEEQEEAYAKIADVRLTRLAGNESEFARHLRSLRRVADVVGGELTPDAYRVARRTLVASGEEIVEFNAISRFFGSWRQAKEALALDDVTTPRKIDARFRSRLVGKPHRYREATLKEILGRCADDLGHPPLVIEFEHWRYRELELAQAKGEELFLPSSSPYRRRWGSWDKALAALGFSAEEIEARFEPGRERSSQSLVRFQFTETADTI